MQVTEYVKLLREYQGPQCYGSMVRGDKCCALGVIAKMKQPGVGTTWEIGEELRAEIEEFQTELTGLGIEIIDLNDDHKLNFKQIADLIEEVLELVKTHNKDVAERMLADKAFEVSHA